MMIKIQNPSEILFKQKIKSGFWLSPHSEEQIAQLQTKYLRDNGAKLRRSTLLTEAIDFLYKHEFTKQE
jgi:hypothetical protein